ncbi:hypothetical protein HD806DRAFT_309792 [Xylariaceae sp. AK1471]|nr:hypothetical protein HD806DRAFT_309792 [Xylariaceae sp. AK1471]
MAELPADSPNKHDEKPITNGKKVAQPERIDAASTSHEEDGAGTHIASRVEDTTQQGHPTSQPQAEPNDSTGEDIPGMEGSGGDDPAAVAEVVEHAAEGAEAQLEVKKKKKKSKKTPRSRRNITGFEEFYADAPMTPAEALEKKKLYDPTRPFADRIEECIQRYRARRRLETERTNMFNKYLLLGGIDTSPRQFTGMVTDKDAMAEADVEQIRSMTATDFVGGSGSRFYDGNDSENWEVDFEAVVKGFLSRTITDWYMYDEKANQTAADLTKNFLNYVLMHDVCPEYTNNLLAARHVCDIAPTELRYIHELVLELPGPFNSAARDLFCEGKVNDLDQDENYESLVQFRLTALLWPLGEKAKLAKEQILKAEDPTTIQVASTTEETYQVLGIERPRRKDKKTVDEQLAKMELPRKLKPAGVLRVAPSIIAHGWGNIPRPEEVDFSEAEEEEFILEDELLAKFEVGMKISMTVCELTVGLRFIKQVHDLRVSFDTFLPQYLMTHWKNPVPNERPPPSIHNPDAEEKVMDAEIQAED